ncbi:Oidioi.mRNA.OKI2018_I69.XSR.g13253.t1.cds [Oikopleura dioica]|uniref:Oidioi.mRNA.OKI2018_I69.XSR.g13253.t1.cds n=1 Tax=Oikopleura dioica TaxID=34765 RepID=A0ABN7SEQ2_OIKDI|nr:Oidioi.mRNA.OKI2018_I69.XSR.g13253.t1.cds [Oikopleura dioica]
MSSTVSLFELAIEAAVKIPFNEVDEFFLSRGQLVPEDDLVIKCANATLPDLAVIEAIEFDARKDEITDCECAQFKNVNQSGFMIFATWSCRVHGSGTVSVKWSQRRVTSFSCHCTPSQSFLFMCPHAAMLLKRRIQKCPYSVDNQLAPLTNILMNLSVSQLQETLLEVTQWEISGKDIFDLNFDIDDPIECIPDVTMDNESGMHEHWMFLNKEVNFSSEKQIGQTSKAILKLARLSSSFPEVVYLFKDIVDFCDTANDEMMKVSHSLYAALLAHEPLHSLVEQFERLFPELRLSGFREKLEPRCASLFAAESLSLTMIEVVDSLLSAAFPSVELFFSFLIPALVVIYKRESEKPSSWQLLNYMQPSILHLDARELSRVKNCLSVAFP